MSGGDCAGVPRPGWITRGAYYDFGGATQVIKKGGSHVIFMRLFRTITIT
jgi:hypothetical protein